MTKLKSLMEISYFYDNFFTELNVEYKNFKFYFFIKFYKKSNFLFLDIKLYVGFFDYIKIIKLDSIEKY